MRDELPTETIFCDPDPARSALAPCVDASNRRRLALGYMTPIGVR